METTASPDGMAIERDQRLSDQFQRDRSRLLGFIRRRVADPLDAEDVLQDVFYVLRLRERLQDIYDELMAK